MLTPDQKEIISDFTEESENILNEMENLLEQLSDEDQDPEGFVMVGQKIDGIMGCAKTLGIDGMPELAPALKVISNLAEGCKAVGYKGGQIKEPTLVPIVAGFLADAVEMLSAAVGDLKKGYISFDQDQADRVKERLIWLSAKLKMSEADKAAIMARFGLK